MTGPRRMPLANLLDAVIPPPAPRPIPARPAAKAKRRLPAYVTEECAEAAKNTLVGAYGRPDSPRSLSELVEDALWAEIGRLESAHNGGEPFPLRPARLRNLPTGPRA